MRASVGDTILFHFLNRLEYPVSVHAHGVFYNKSGEGALYADGTSGGFARSNSFDCILVWHARDNVGARASAIRCL